MSREPIAVGQPLPTLPLWLRGGLCLPVELEATYRASLHRAARAAGRVTPSQALRGADRIAVSPLPARDTLNSESFRVQYRVASL